MEAGKNKSGVGSLGSYRWFINFDLKQSKQTLFAKSCPRKPLKSHKAIDCIDR
jgi:hypothetical protein